MASTRQPRHNGRSIPFTIFQRALESEIRTSYMCRTALTYAERWWAHVQADQKFERLTDYPGDAKRPFSGISVRVSEYLGSYRSDAEQAVRGNTIINIHTALEVYLTAVLQRAIFIQPTLVSESGLQVEVGSIARIANEVELRRWLGDIVAKAYMYNKSHARMIAWIDNAVKAGIGRKTCVTTWKRWSDVRNALIHSGRRAGANLARVWPERFGEKRSLDDADVTNCHATAFAVASVLDEQILRTHIHDADVMLFARELFVRYGVEDGGKLSVAAHDCLDARLPKHRAQKAVAIQKSVCTSPTDECAALESLVTEWWDERGEAMLS